MSFLRGLPAVARYTLRRHIPAELLLQVYAGATFAQFDIVARKEFGASNLLIAFFFVGPHLPALLSAFWGASMAGRSRGIFLAAAAVFGPFLLLGMPLVHTPLAFMALCAFSLLGDPILVPFRNRLLQANYPASARGRIWGWIFGAGRVAHLASSLLTGFILDEFPGSHRTVFPAAGLLGLAGIFLYSRVRLRWTGGEAASSGKRWWRQIADLFRDTPGFAAFEGTFMVYGFAFMLLLPLYVIVVNDILRLSYVQAALLRQVIPQMTLAIVSPLAGRILDRSNPLRTGASAFATLAVFPLLMIGAIHAESFWIAAAAYVVFGIAMAFLHTAWELGPTWFAGKRDSSRYMGIHMSCVGLRGTIGPPVGGMLATLIGITGTFAVSAVLFAVASLWMRSLVRRLGNVAPPITDPPVVPGPGATRLPPRGA